LITPIVHSAPYAFETTSDLIDFMEGKSDRVQPEYGRMGNPTISRVQKAVAALDGGEEAVLFASGMCAVTTTLLTFLRPGDHIVITSDIYHRTRQFVFEFLDKFGIEGSVVEPSADGIEKAVTGKTRIVFTETPTNPYLRVVDIRRVAEMGRRRNILTVTDSTFATPVNLRPLEHGIDLVIHSATKYLGGHNDMLGGVLVGRGELVSQVAELLATMGGIMDPNTAFLLDRGLKTLAVRVAWQNDSARRLAEFLEGHRKVRQVFYPGLKDHPDHGLARELLAGFGGVVTFLVDADFKGTCRFVDNLQLMHIAPSLGGTETLVDPPVPMSFWDYRPEERRKLGMLDNLVRLAVGLEDTDDLIDDLEQALAAV